MSDYSKGSAYVDGEIVPISQAKISLLDWGFLHSDATYDVVHVWNDRFFRLDDHIKRFYSGMKKLRMSIPYDAEELTSILNDCVKETNLSNAYVEMIATRGLPQPGSRDPRTCTNRLYAFAIPFVWITRPGRGLHLIVTKRERIPPNSVDPLVKNYHWLDLVMSQFEAYDAGGETAVVIDAEGHIKEGPGFNIFAVKNATLTTPSVGILEGITRKTAIELALHFGYTVNQTEISAKHLYTADEVFVTSTAGGIMPITKVDQQFIGNGEIGPMTIKLQKQYWALHEDDRYTLAIK